MTSTAPISPTCAGPTARKVGAYPGASAGACLAVAALLASPCRADEPVLTTSTSPVLATAPAAHPVFKLRTPKPSLELQYHRLEPVNEPTPSMPDTRTERMQRAFAEELREEAITSRRAALYATIPEQLPELLEDDWIRKQQERVAQSVIGDAVEAALTEGFFGGKHSESKLSIRPLVAASEHGLHVDASPSWSYRVRAPRSGFSVDVPLTPSSIRLHAYKDLRGTDHGELRLGGGVLLDPFDQEVRAGISLQF